MGDGDLIRGEPDAGCQVHALKALVHLGMALVGASALFLVWLFCPVLFCPVFFCSVLFCPVLFS